MARPRSHGRLIRSFGVAWYEEDKDTLTGMDDLRGKDNLGEGDFVKQAVREYVARHLPGNPTIPLTHWTDNESLSISAQEKLELDRHIEIDCAECSGSGENRWGATCRHCNGVGKIGVESAP